MEKNTLWFKRITNIKNPAKIKPALSSTLLASVAMTNLAETARSDGKASMATLVIRVEPKYPVEAARDNQEESVILQFNITKDGSTDSIQVIESLPQQIFDKVSVTALKQWTYKPKIQGGQAQRQTDITVQLDFRMDELDKGKSAIDFSVKKIKVLH
jgi:bla regulator protein BlaR1